MPRLGIGSLLLALVWSGCGSGQKREPTIGHGFVGPATLNLRSELGADQPTVATVRHGERLEILRRRRVFVKVRTSGGAEGWTDGRLLFSPGQMDDLKWLAGQAARLPSQGTAAVHGRLNLHNEPNRQAPSFHQLQDGDRVEVVAHCLAPRVPYNPGAPPPAVSPSTPLDDWSLVRTAEGRAGWALFRMLTMAVPDEVAQYAEGRLITSYFSLGTVTDGKAVKHNWLWTTIARGLEPYQFDSFRVFVWNRRRHRYETAYIERNLKGYYPVEVEPAGSDGAMPRFSLIVEGSDGRRYRRTYAFQGFRVRMVARDPWNKPVPQLHPPSRPAPERPGQEAKPFLTRIREALANLRR